MATFSSTELTISMVVGRKKRKHRAHANSLVAIDEGMVLDQPPGQRSGHLRRRGIGIVKRLVGCARDGTFQQSTITQTVRPTKFLDQIGVNAFHNFNRRKDHYFASSR